MCRKTQCGKQRYYINSETYTKTLIDSHDRDIDGTVAYLGPCQTSIMALFCRRSFTIFTKKVS